MIRSLVLAAPLLVAACSGANDLRPAPHALYFSPSHRELTLRLGHDGDQPLPLSRIRVDHRDPDWSAFTLVDPALPKQIAAHGEVVLRLRVDLDHFADHRGAHGYRSGSAGLTLLADGEPTRIDLHFADDTPQPAPLVIRLGLLTLLAAALVTLRRRISWSLGLPAAVALAIAPLGPGLCWDLATALGPADLQQCADGRGGVSLQMLPHADGLGLYLAVLLFSALEGISTAALSRRLALALTVLTVALAAHSLDPQTLAQAQSGARWGLWMQPFAAAALGLAALGELAAARSHGPLATRVGALGLAAVITTLSLGGADLPGLQPLMARLPHAAGLGLGLGTWLLKVTAVAWLLRRVQHPPRAAWLVLPLLLAQLLWSLIFAPAPVA